MIAEDDLPRDWVDSSVQQDIAALEDRILQHNWTLQMHAGFAGLRDDERFKRLTTAMSDQRIELLERLATALSITPQRLGRLQGQLWALAYFTQLAKGDPAEVQKARDDLPGLTENLKRLRSLLHVPGATPGRGVQGDDRDREG